MHVFACPLCGSSDLESKDIELRHVNPTTRESTSRHIVELECKNCGWFGSVEQAEDAESYLETHSPK